MADPEAPEPDATEAVAPAAEQFQRAALEAIRAARSMLDAAEAVVADPKALDSVVRTVTSMARSTGETVLGFAAGMAADRTAASPTDAEAEARAGAGDDPDDGFHRIVVD